MSIAGHAADPRARDLCDLDLTVSAMWFHAPAFRKDGNLVFTEAVVVYAALRHKLEHEDSQWVEWPNSAVAIDLGLTINQARRVMTFLRQQGLVRRQHRTIEVLGHRFPMVQFVALGDRDPDVTGQAQGA